MDQLSRRLHHHAPLAQSSGVFFAFLPMPKASHRATTVNGGPGKQP
jgi:hypothetical protein